MPIVSIYVLSSLQHVPNPFLLFGHPGAKLIEGGDASVKSKTKRCPPLHGRLCFYEPQRPNSSNEALKMFPNMRKTL